MVGNQAYGKDVSKMRRWGLSFFLRKAVLGLGSGFGVHVYIKYRLSHHHHYRHHHQMAIISSIKCQ